MIVSQEKVINCIRFDQDSIHPPGFAPLSVDLLENIVQRIVNGVHPQKIILFGSYAYGDPNADSDLDLLVIMESPNRPAKVTGVTRLLRPRPFPMIFWCALLKKSTMDWQKRIALFKKYYLGIVLYEATMIYGATFPCPTMCWKIPESTPGHRTVPFPRTHDLSAIGQTVPTKSHYFDNSEDDLDNLSAFAVEVRTQNQSTSEEAKEALSIAKIIRKKLKKPIEIISNEPPMEEQPDDMAARIGV